MKYSIDFRERVIAFIQEGGTISAASRTFHIARTTIDKWCRKKTETGTLEYAVPRTNYRKLNPKELISYVKDHPDLSLAEYGKHFGTSSASVCKAFKRLKITRRYYGLTDGSKT